MLLDGASVPVAENHYIGIKFWFKQESREAEFAIVVRAARYQYHRVVEDARKNEELQKKEVLITEILQQSRLWEEMEKMRCHYRRLPGCVDYAINSQEVADVIFVVNAYLYSTVTSNKSELENYQ